MYYDVEENGKETLSGVECQDSLSAVIYALISRHNELFNKLLNENVNFKVTDINGIERNYFTKDGSIYRSESKNLIARVHSFI